MTFFDLFAGIGGFHLGLKKNFECVGACEIDRHARQVYSKHFPNVRIWEDATKLSPEELPDFDILTAGFPCQAFSLAGKRLGFEESRGTLFHEIARIAKQKRPGILFLENVRGLLYHDDGRTLTTIIKTFHELGYDIEWQVINSKHFVPQNRERIFIIGHLGDKPSRKIFPLGEINQINVGTPEKAQEQGQRLRGAYTRTIDSNYAKGGGSRTMILMTGHNTQNGKKIEFNHAFALTTLREQVVCHKNKVRQLTPLECERLQGFPDGWTDGLSNTHRYKCLGNAVTVPVIEYIAERL